MTTDNIIYRQHVTIESDASDYDEDSGWGVKVEAFYDTRDQSSDGKRSKPLKALEDAFPSASEIAAFIDAHLAKKGFTIKDGS